MAPVCIKSPTEFLATGIFSHAILSYNMSKELIIVESPTKAKTLTRFLGQEYEIVASYGHIRDLPKSKFGIDPDKNFAIDYVIPKDKEALVDSLKKLSKKSSHLILATDPDREGEAIAWHLKYLLKGTVKNPQDIERIVFHEITEEAVREALGHPRKIDERMVDSQQARRVLDRIVGYKLSPLLWRKVRRGLSAGRVQSIALRFIVDREREIEKFKPTEYWSLIANLVKGTAMFSAELATKSGKKFEIAKEPEAKKVVSELDKSSYVVEKVTYKEAHKSPYPPFTTSTMVQAASNKLGFTSKKTMKIAQDLYEEGLITYMRTDSVNLAASAVDKTRAFIKKTYGQNLLARVARIYKTKSRGAQEAHEAIRPSLVERTPEALKKDLDRDHLRLYTVIWQRMVACQMAEAVYDQTTVEIKAGVYGFRAHGSVTRFAGWLSVYQAASTSEDEEKENKLPELKEGDDLTLKELLPEQHFTQPPARYNEASLIKELEEKGIGRPSTYAPTLSTIQERRYVEKLDRRFTPTPLGIAVCDFLTTNFEEEVEPEFTAEMEEQLDKIADGESKWVEVVKKFYTPFSNHVEQVAKNSQRVKIEAEMTDIKCDLCGKPMLIRYGRFGKFLACSGFPDCKETKTYEEKVEAKCPDCGSDVVVRRTRKGRRFYGCASYPKCNWMNWHLPQPIGKSQNSDAAELQK